MGHHKVFEPVLLLGKARFAGVDIRIRVNGGGNVSRTYAIRQAIAKAIVAYYQKSLTRLRRTRSKTSSFPTTARSSSRTRAARRRRSSADVVPARASRSRTADRVD